MQVGSLVLALQQQTNNVAEYCGLIIGLEVDCLLTAFLSEAEIVAY